MNIFRRHLPATIEVGSLLNKRYRLANQLGEGGAGIVYKAEDQQLKRMVAIKVLTSGGGMAADKLERFRSEARSVARLNHPNIVTLYDYAEEYGRPYLVMEYVPGQDLWELDNSYTPNLMPFEEALPIIDDILAALEYSHQNSVIHRDLKPENVMVTPDRQVRVMDFGLARIEGQSRLTKQGLVAGTASYLAPELALGEPGDHRVDLYALGVMMYELFTGRRPFADDDPLTVISQHIHAPVVPPQHYNSNIPDDIQRIVLQLLAKRPEERYQSATDVRKELRPMLQRLRGDTKELDKTIAYPLPANLSDTPGISHQTLLDRIARGKMIGRVSELDVLKQRWDLARLGESHEPFVLISGEGGIGKTRLLRELEVYTNLRDGYVLKDIALEQDIGRPYALFINTLQTYIQQQPAQVLHRQMSGYIAGEVVKFVPQLTDKLGYIPPNPPLEPEAERARLLSQISKFVLDLAYERPTLLLFDDLQYADSGSLDILSMILDQSAGASIMIIAAYRDVGISYSSPINRFISAENISHKIYDMRLRRLSEEYTGRMLEALLGSTVSEPFTHTIYRATEGNPLYVEEVVKGLVVDGQIVLKQGRWEQRENSQLHVPGSIKAVIGRRLDRLDRHALRVLQLAAALGRSFNFNVLVEASGDDENSIHKIIDDAITAQLVEILSVEKSTYQFQHAVIRETLYEDLRSLRRRQLHRKVAGAMERLTGAGESQSPALLARHLIDGAQDERAVPYLRQAGGKARQIHANDDAVEHYAEAQEILEDMAMDLRGEALQENLRQQFEILSAKRAILNLSGKRDRELSALTLMQEVATSLNDPKRQVEAMSRLADFDWQTGKLQQAREVAFQGLKVAQENNDKEGESHCLEQLARLLWTQRDPESMNYATQALVIVQGLKDRNREGQLSTLVGHIYADTLYDTERAAIYFEQALTVCREINNQVDEAWTLWGIGKLALFVNDYERALKRYGEAKTISKNLGATVQMGWNLYHMGDAWYNLGNYKEALQCYEEAQTIFIDAHHARGKILALISIGLTLMVGGTSPTEDNDENEQVTQNFEQAKQLAEKRQDATLMLYCYEAMSSYFRALGGEIHLTNSIRLGNRVIKLANQNTYTEHELLGHYLRGTGFYNLGNINEAYKSLHKAIELLEPLAYLQSSFISIAEIYYRYGRILTALQHQEMARTYLQKAYLEVRRKADLITDSEKRNVFLRDVLINRKIFAAFGSS